MSNDNVQQFTHLNVHSEFSLIDSLIRIKALTQQCKALGMTAVALTDHVNIFAAVKFYRACLNSGVKPILGADLRLENPENSRQAFHVLLLCQNNQGYLNLVELISKAYTQGQTYYLPLIKKQWLDAHHDGLIALSGGLYGDIGQALIGGNVPLAEQLLQQWQQWFPGRFYLELQRVGHQGEENYIAHAVKLAASHNVPLVATNQVRFLQAEDFSAHEARVCIHDGTQLNDARRARKYTDKQYLRSTKEMAELFADLPQALTNSVEIAKRCNLVLKLTPDYLPGFPAFNLKKSAFPNFVVPEGMNVENYLIAQAKSGLEERLAFFKVPPEKHDVYRERLQFELDIIINMGFAGYFLIVADFINWARNNDIPIGPGRGSGAGSLVAYALKITDPDPLAYHLLFERFLNPERISMPDFDIDFCIEGRDRVIKYVADKYGHDSVSQIITFGTMAARAVVRDVGRVLGLPYGFVDKIAKLIPFELGITLDKALQEDELKNRYQQEDDVRNLIDLAKSLEGLARNAGKHAAGVVIAPGKLTRFTAIYCETGDATPVSHFDKIDIEAVGLVKFDFLGLRNLTIINNAVKSINSNRAKRHEPPLDIRALPLDDDKTFQLLRDCKTTAIFQLESRGITDLVKKLQPNCLEDIVSLVALFRPGPLQSGMVDDFINRRHGRTRVEYPHPLLEPILKPTYGVILYQEQVMQIAQVLAGYTLGSADVLRKAMGKKKPEEMAKQRLVFVEGATEREVDPHVAGKIFDLMEKFAGYGFNKSHSVAYGLVTYQTAYLKAHYPAEFMAAVLSSDMDHTDKVLRFFHDAKALGLTITTPDINSGDYAFTVNDEGEICYGLGAIKGAGEAALTSVLEERQRGGPFKNMLDFCLRNNLRKVNKKVIEALIKSGAMDKLGHHRAEMMENVPTMLQAAEHQLQHETQDDLFGGFSQPEQQDLQLKPVDEWSDRARLRAEKEALGLYLSGHPMTPYWLEFGQLLTNRLAELKLTTNQTVMVAGLVSSLRTVMTKRGDRIAFATLDDNSARVEISLFADVYQQHRELLHNDEVVIVEGEVSLDNFSGNYRLRCQQVLTVTQFREKWAKCLSLSFTNQSDQSNQDFSQQLATVLQTHRGGTCPIHIVYQQQQADAVISLGKDWQIKPDDEVLSRLKGAFPGSEVRFVY